jgi:hypothetical protein
MLREDRFSWLYIKTGPFFLGRTSSFPFVPMRVKMSAQFDVHAVVVRCFNKWYGLFLLRNKLGNISQLVIGSLRHVAWLIERKQISINFNNNLLRPDVISRRVDLLQLCGFFSWSGRDKWCGRWTLFHPACTHWSWSRLFGMRQMAKQGGCLIGRPVPTHTYPAITTCISEDFIVGLHVHVHGWGNGQKYGEKHFARLKCFKSTNGCRQKKLIISH